MATKRLLGGAAIMSALLLGSAAMAATHLTAKPESLQALGTVNPASIALNNAATQIAGRTGARVMDIRFYDGAGHPTYIAVVSKGRVVQTVRMDGMDGRIRQIRGTEVPDWALNWIRRADVHSMRHASVPLSRAIATAENAANAPAIEAGLARPLTANNRVLAYNVEVVMYGRPELVAVDANTDEVIANPNALGLADRDPGFFLPNANYGAG